MHTDSDAYADPYPYSHSHAHTHADAYGGAHGYVFVNAASHRDAHVGAGANCTDRHADTAADCAHGAQRVPACGGSGGAMCPHYPKPD